MTPETDRNWYNRALAQLQRDQEVEERRLARRAATQRANRERLRIVRPQGDRTPGRRAIAQCGTDSGYYRHLRTIGEAACDDCLDAHAAATAARTGRTA